MAIMKPFKGIRPRADLASRIAALPYDVYNREEAFAEVQKEPLSFLKIDRAETQFDSSVDTYDPCVYQKARTILNQMIQEGCFVQDVEEIYYLYRLTMNGRSQTGIVACASIDDYQNNTIKKHENTRADKEEDRIRHVDACDAQTGPIFLAYRAHKEIDAVVEENLKKRPSYDFVSSDEVRHTVWCISNPQDIRVIQESFAGMNEIYIADGHHRAASAVKVGQKRREEHSGYTGQEEFNYFLSVLFPHDQLMIMDYNRVVKDLNGHTIESYLEQIQTNFTLKAEGTEPYRPASKGSFGMYLNGIWYSLTAKPEVQSEDPVEGLDVSLLQNYLLGPVLGIEDPRTDKRIDFVGGIRGLEELERRANSDMKLAFALYPTSIVELFSVADVGLLMPPKSTWFEPKLRSGLLIHSLKQ